MVRRLQYPFSRFSRSLATLNPHAATVRRSQYPFARFPRSLATLNPSISTNSSHYNLGPNCLLQRYVVPRYPFQVFRTHSQAAQRMLMHPPSYWRFDGTSSIMFFRFPHLLATSNPPIQHPLAHLNSSVTSASNKQTSWRSRPWRWSLTLSGG